MKILSMVKKNLFICCIVLISGFFLHGKMADAAYAGSSDTIGVVYDDSIWGESCVGVSINKNGHLVSFGLDTWSNIGESEWKYKGSNINDKVGNITSSDMGETIFLRDSSVGRFGINAQKLREYLTGDYSVILKKYKCGKCIYQSFEMSSASDSECLPDDESFVKTLREEKLGMMLSSYAHDGVSYIYDIYDALTIGENGDIQVQAPSGVSVTGTGMAYYGAEGLYFIKSLPLSTYDDSEGHICEFEGWYTQETGGDLINVGDFIKEGTVLYPRWKVKDISYSVKIVDICGYDENGEELGSTTVEADYNTYVNGGMAGTISDEGYYYKGMIYQGESMALVQDENCVVYRYFSPIKYDLHLEGYKSNDQYLSFGIIRNISYGDEIVLPPNEYERKEIIYTDANIDEEFTKKMPVSIVYEFAGWSLSRGGEVVYKDCDIVKNLSEISDTVTLYTAWTEKNITLAEPKERDGYTFGGWSLLCDDSEGKKEIKNTDLTEESVWYAIWIPNKYKIQYALKNSRVDEALSLFKTEYTYMEDTPLIEPFVERGYEFVCWSTSGDIKDRVDIIKAGEKGDRILYPVIIEQKKSEDDSKADITPKPNTTDKPDITPKPNTTDKPDITPKPNATDKPDITPKPDTTDKPDITPKPDITDKSGTTPKPDTTDKSGTTPKPDITDKSGTSGGNGSTGSISTGGSSSGGSAGSISTGGSSSGGSAGSISTGGSSLGGSTGSVSTGGTSSGGGTGSVSTGGTSSGGSTGSVSTGGSSSWGGSTGSVSTGGSSSGGSTENKDTGTSKADDKKASPSPLPVLSPTPDLKSSKEKTANENKTQPTKQPSKTSEDNKNQQTISPNPSKTPANGNKPSVRKNGKKDKTSTKKSTGGKSKASVTLTKGSQYTKDGIIYKIIKNTKKTKTVTVYRGKKGLVNVNIPEYITIHKSKFTVISISKEAFKKCSKLSKVKTGDKVKIIGKKAFKNLRNLKKITIGKGVTEIGEEAFSNTKKLQSITINSKKIKVVGKKAFYGTNSKCKLKIIGSKNYAQGIINSIV